jgi:hypothetical protein
MPRGIRKTAEEKAALNTYEPADRGMSRAEQETIINFNKEEDVAYVFTYEYTWIKHIETKLHIQCSKDNGHGGKEFVVPKRLISKPRVPTTVKRVLSPERKAQMLATLKKARENKV